MLTKWGHWKIKWDDVIGVLTKLWDILKVLLKSKKILDLFWSIFWCDLPWREKYEVFFFCYIIMIWYIIAV